MSDHKIGELVMDEQTVGYISAIIPIDGTEGFRYTITWFFKGTVQEKNSSDYAVTQFKRELNEYL
jgi:hypothetical protein